MIMNKKIILKGLGFVPLLCVCVYACVCACVCVRACVCARVCVCARTHAQEDVYSRLYHSRSRDCMSDPLRSD